MVSDWGNFSFIFKDDLHKPQNRGVWYSFTTRKKSLQFHSWYLFTHNLSYDIYYNNFAQRQAEYHSAVLYKTELGLFHRKKCNRTPPSPPHPFTEMTRHFVCARPHIALSSRLEISGKISAKKQTAAANWKCLLSSCIIMFAMAFILTRNSLSSSVNFYNKGKLLINYWNITHI